MSQESVARKEEHKKKRKELDTVLEAAAAFRYKYVNLAMGAPSFSATFQELLDEFEQDEIPHAISALIRLISSDIAGSTPYIPMGQMKNIIDYLSQLKIIANLYRRSNELLEKTAKYYDPVNAEAQDIIKPVLRLKNERMISPQQVKHRMKFLESENPSRDIMLIQGIANLVQRDMPHKMFPTLENREALMGAIQGVLDEAINREERMIPL
ncbi:MAG: TyeA family type III secretion system gatekeeper subunit [Desulfovibrionales bacterium]|nr:TyeA family type III secretion system gatekeeper subunit [Desulfovibrionales bacterium]